MWNLFIICSIIASLNDLTYAHRCETPSGTNGSCVHLEDCSQFYGILLNWETASREEQLLLRQSTCGYRGLEPLVCCVSPTLRSTNTTTLSNSTVTKSAEIFPLPGICGAVPSDRILYGGKEAPLGGYPWLALLQYSKREHNLTIRCGGSLINKNYVLTAAHCVRGRKLRGWVPTSIRLGEHDLRTNPDCEELIGCADPVTEVSIAKIIVHEQYSEHSNTQVHDIALIRLAHSINYTDSIRPICLPSAPQLQNKSFDNIDLKVAGFGSIENGTTSDIKLFIDIAGVNWDRCNEIYTKRAGVSLAPTQLCVGGVEGVDSCSGDSGGPLFGLDHSDLATPYYYLAGVVSRGPRTCGTSGFPSLYTRVDKYLDWIVDRINQDKSE